MPSAHTRTSDLTSSSSNSFIELLSPLYKSCRTSTFCSMAVILPFSHGMSKIYVHLRDGGGRPAWTGKSRQRKRERSAYKQHQTNIHSTMYQTTFQTSQDHEARSAKSMWWYQLGKEVAEVEQYKQWEHWVSLHFLVTSVYQQRYGRLHLVAILLGVQASSTMVYLFN